ncbi:circadian clock protein KaiA [Fischerella sp. JS2]|uniref:circadian clock protein KaiA n=1 Tax=Fischerella sp. JS2 TaxID=2597771 RepID=UPI0028ED1658|nr:circadian clock protein KaiA [Fischerella sp. JS2]
MNRCQQPEQQSFFHQMTKAEQQAFLQELKSDYRQILIDYFTTDKTLKEKIDKFINAVFCANIPVPQIIEIHMELIDEFSKQLKLEGRSDETLLDYRLTLIDILAHLCELYRRSLPK